MCVYIFTRKNESTPLQVLAFQTQVSPHVSVTLSQLFVDLYSGNLGTGGLMIHNVEIYT